MAKRVPLRKRIRRLEVRIQRSTRVQSLIRRCYSGYIRFVERTTRWQYLGMEAYGPDGDRQPLVVCTWHSHLSCTPIIARLIERRASAIASDHPDGQIVLELLRAMGMDAILVSTSGDKMQPIRAAVRLLRKGGTLGMTTDGPMGPPGESKPGAVTIASLSGAPLVAVGFAARPVLRLPTWDRFILPLPFGRAVLSIGPTIPVGKRLDSTAIQATCATLDAAINAEIQRCSDALNKKRPG